ncbi:MAG: hypothetical protein ACI8X5_003946, partial [Planctomycetota bacterium]
RNAQPKNRRPVARILGLEDEHQVTRGKSLYVAQPKSDELWLNLADQLRNLTGVQTQESSSSTL